MLFTILSMNPHPQGIISPVDTVRALSVGFIHKIVKAAKSEIRPYLSQVLKVSALHLKETDSAIQRCKQSRVYDGEATNDL